MKYLACAFRNGVMLYSSKVTSEQIMFFKDNVCSMFNVDVESLNIVKYDLEEINKFESYESFSTKISETEVSLVSFKETEVDTAVAVDMMNAPMSELEEFYSEEEIQLILDNRDVWFQNEEAELPNKVARRIKYGKKIVKEESVVATLQPEL